MRPVGHREGLRRRDGCLDLCLTMTLEGEAPAGLVKRCAPVPAHSPKSSR